MCTPSQTRVGSEDTVLPSNSVTFRAQRLMVVSSFSKKLLLTSFRRPVAKSIDDPPPQLVPRQATGQQHPWSERCYEVTNELPVGLFGRWPWNHVSKECGLTSEEPRRTQEACFSKIKEGDLSALLNYLDDTLHILIVPLERVTGNDGVEYDFADNRESTVGVAST